MTAESEQSRTVEIRGVSLAVVERGSGEPLLFLHPGYPGGRFGPSEPILDLLSSSFRVISPTHPGFGRADAPDWMTTVDDLAYFYLDVLDHLALSDVVVVGASLGGWIAAQMAVKSTARLSRIVLANPVGIKVGDRETRDIVDIYSIVDAEIAELAYADSAVGVTDYGALSDDELFYVARSREATARYGWSPYLHDPKLKGRLHRIDIPTLLIWGEADRITSSEYGRAYAAAIPGAVFLPIRGAGHFPHREKPAEFAQHIVAFCRGDTLEPAS